MSVKSAKGKSNEKPRLAVSAPFEWDKPFLPSVKHGSKESDSEDEMPIKVNMLNFYYRY